MPKHVLILGCGRSGTSIFGELFEHLPNYSYYSEPDFEAFLNFDFSKPIAAKVPRENAKFPPSPGLSFPLELLQETLTDQVEYYWIIRHPLDTICSLKVGISRNWGHHPKPPDWQNWLSEPLLKQCAHHWNYLNTVGFEQVKNLVKIKYFEELILETETYAQNICEDLELDKSIIQPALSDWRQRVQNVNNSKFKEAKTSQAYSTNDHKVRVGRWKENLTASEVAMVWPMVEATATRFGYLLANNSSKE